MKNMTRFGVLMFFPFASSGHLMNKFSSMNLDDSSSFSSEVNENYQLMLNKVSVWKQRLAYQQQHSLPDVMTGFSSP